MVHLEWSRILNDIIVWFENRCIKTTSKTHGIDSKPTKAPRKLVCITAMKVWGVGELIHSVGDLCRPISKVLALLAVLPPHITLLERSILPWTMT